MPSDTQISAVISRDTKELLEQLVRSTGLKKGYVLEMALRHHLQALQELPADVVIPPRLVVSKRSGGELSERIRSRRRPSKALRDLMSGHGH